MLFHTEPYSTHLSFYPQGILEPHYMGMEGQLCNTLSLVLVIYHVVANLFYPLPFHVWNTLIIFIAWRLMFETPLSKHLFYKALFPSLCVFDIDISVSYKTTVVLSNAKIYFIPWKKSTKIHTKIILEVRFILTVLFLVCIKSLLLRSWKLMCQTSIFALQETL